MKKRDRAGRKGAHKHSNKNGPASAISSTPAKRWKRGVRIQSTRTRIKGVGDGSLGHLLPPLYRDVLSRLDARALLVLATVSREVHLRVAHDAATWRRCCAALWANKAFVPEKFASATPSRTVFLGSIRDGTRSRFDGPEELMGMNFAFRFKFQAGPEWVVDDPSWALQTEVATLQRLARSLFDAFPYMDENEIAEASAILVRPDRWVERGSCACSKTERGLEWSMRWTGSDAALFRRRRGSTSDLGEGPEPGVRPPGPMLIRFTSAPTSGAPTHAARRGGLVENRSAPSRQSALERLIAQEYPRIVWRMTKSRQGRRGQFVKINHWPALTVTRLEDWGWQLDSCWVRYRTPCPVTLRLTKEWLDDRPPYQPPCRETTSGASLDSVVGRGRAVRAAKPLAAMLDRRWRKEWDRGMIGID
jgi:hypothetical protein